MGLGLGVTHGAGDGLSEFPSDLADAGTAGSAAAFSVQTCDASALVTLASSIRGSDAPALCMRVLVAVSVTAWAGVSTAAAGTARPAHVRHPSCRFSRLQKEIAGRDDAERKKAIYRRSRFFRHSRVTRRGLPNPKGGAAQAIGLRDHDRHRTPGRAVQGGDHAIVVRSTRCWRRQSGANSSLKPNFLASWENTGKFINFGLHIRISYRKHDWDQYLTAKIPYAMEQGINCALAGN